MRQSIKGQTCSASLTRKGRYENDPSPYFIQICSFVNLEFDGNQIVLVRNDKKHRYAMETSSHMLKKPMLLKK